MTEDWPFYSLVQFLPLTFELGRKGGREGERSVSLQVSRPTKWKFWELLKVIYLTHEPESQEGSKKGWGEAQRRCGGKSLTASKSLGLVPSWGPAKPRSLGSVRHPCVLGVTFKILNDGTGKQNSGQGQTAGTQSWQSAVIAGITGFVTEHKVLRNPQGTG